MAEDPKARARRGALLAAHHEPVLRLCRLVLADRDLAQDACQDVFLKLAERPPPEGADARKWIARMAINRCRDVKRSAWWSRRSKSASFDELAWELADESRASSPERETVGLQERERIHSALRGLSSRQREVFLLRHFEEWTTEEVAEALGLTTGSVKQHLFRAVARLREALGER